MLNPKSRAVLSVSELAETLRGLVESSLPSIWVQGEVSNFRNPSGHWYFTLKDAQAQIRVAMFKGANFHVRPIPKDGDQVLIRGAVSFYSARGDLQIIAEHLEPAGAGALLRAFEELKKKLAAEGLFDEKLKRPIPAVPRHIGIITSPTGAALQDMLTTLRRRFPLGQVTIYPVPVQGEAAAPALIKALADFPKRAGVDVILLARGGGSIEDLWAFNDEKLARAIRACPVPVVTGIGHEIDFTTADFAADLRAPTPTAAAELVSPDIAEWRQQLQALGEALAHSIEAGLELQEQKSDTLATRLEAAHPGRRLQQNIQRVDELRERLQQAQARGMARFDERQRQAAALLTAFNPLAVLQRGYAIVQTLEGAVLRRAQDVVQGVELKIRLAEGVLSATAGKTA
ncbi:MAG: exodeoxyribonuclease VII large subunit [Pseudomonadota bacterium]